MGFLARGQKLRPLISEFSHFAHGFLTLAKMNKKPTRFCTQFPKGARIVHRKLVKWGEVRVDDVDGKLFANSSYNIDGGYKHCDIIEKISFGSRENQMICERSY